MVRAFKAMDAWAVSEGLEPVSQVKAVEGETEMGVMAVVKDEQDALQNLAIRPDVKQVWTIAELGRLVSSGIGEDLWRLKQEMPFRATVVEVKQERPVAKPVAGGASGFEDIENDFDVDKPVGLPKMFTLPQKAAKG